MHVTKCAKFLITIIHYCIRSNYSINMPRMSSSSPVLNPPSINVPISTLKYTMALFQLVMMLSNLQIHFVHTTNYFDLTPECATLTSSGKSPTKFPTYSWLVANSCDIVTTLRWLIGSDSHPRPGLVLD